MSNFAYLIRYLYSTLRWKLFVWLTLIILASVLEGRHTRAVPTGNCRR